MSEIYEGFAYFTHGKLQYGVFIPDRGNRIQGVTASGRNVKIRLKDLLVRFPLDMAASKPRTEVLERLERRLAAADELHDGIDGEALWEWLNEMEIMNPKPEEACAEYFGEYGSFHVIAMIRFMIENTRYFRFDSGPGSFHVRSKAELERERIALVKAKEREDAARDAGDILGGIAATGELRELDPELDKWVDFIEAYVIYGTGSRRLPERFDLFAEKFKEAIRSTYSLREGCEVLLELLGRKKDLTEMEMIRQGFPYEWPAETLADVDEILNRRPIDSHVGQRRDLTGLDTLAVDDEDTTDADDAFSIRMLKGGGTIVWIHIADVASVVPRDSLADKEAFNRSVTLYLPDRKIPMLDSRISEGVASLVPNTNPKRALTLELEFDPDARITRSEFYASLIRPTAHISYETADKWASEDQWGSRLKRLFDITDALCERRAEQGALIVDRQEIKVRVRDDVIEVKIIEDTKARLAVQELMITINSEAGAFCSENKIPAIYRVQNAPEYSEAGFDPENPFQGLRPASLSLIPAAHDSLGIERYIQLSSPIRRYPDLIMQRQIAGFLAAGQPTYQDDLKLLIYARTAEDLYRKAAGLERKITRGWLLSYIRERIPLEVTGEVKDIRPSGAKIIHTILIDDFLLPVPYAATEKLWPVGTVIRCWITGVNQDRSRVELSIEK